MVIKHKQRRILQHVLCWWLASLCGLSALLVCYHDGMAEKDPASKFSPSDHEREADTQNKPAFQSGSDFGPPAIEGMNLCDPQDVLTPEQLQELYDGLL